MARLCKISGGCFVLAASVFAGVDPTQYKVPVIFEMNQGQASADIRFLARARNYSLSVTAEETIFRFAGKAAGIRIRLAGANPRSTIVPLDPLPGHTSYFRGTDGSKWIPNVRHYGRVVRLGVYPGIDHVYYGNKGNLEHDLIVAPGSDPSQIFFEFKGAKGVRVKA